MSLRADPTSIAPERAIVFEVAGSIRNFYAAVQRVEGLEFLADEEFDFEPDEDFAEVDTRRGREGARRTDKLVGGRLYLAMPDLNALKQLLRLWERWKSGERLSAGFAPWQHLFSHLRTLRAWGPADRIPDETIVYWQQKLTESLSEELVRTEVELWFHGVQAKRELAYSRFQKILSASGGRVVDYAVIPEISFEGALVDLPIAEIQRLVDRQNIRLAVCDDIMFLRPQSMVEFPIEVDVMDTTKAAVMVNLKSPQPIAALIDGVPVQRHQLLDGRLIIDDPDGLDSISVVSDRVHGTQMASLILHGDRNLSEPALTRPLFVRPVLFAPGEKQDERTHADRLLIDVIYGAIRRMKEGDDEGEATAPEVFLVNMSLGDINRPFSGPISPWARLLDFLSDRYGILFLVSAGNIKDPLLLSTFRTWQEFEDALESEREEAILNALFEQKSQRTLLSPAEALNVLTVGAWHEDAVDRRHQSSLTADPYVGAELPNVSSALGLGHRRVVKPEIYLPGGRELVSFQKIADKLFIRTVSNGRGIRAAIPHSGGALDKEALACGTSVAAALATRAAHRLFEALMDQDSGSLHTEMNPDFYAVVVKALLVHRARWGTKGQFLDTLYGPHGLGANVARKDNIARVLGYGRPVLEEAIACAPNRATMVGHGEISDSHSANLYRIPLPSSLERITEPRSISITLAWFSPVNPRHQAYRCAKLEASAAPNLEAAFGVEWIPDQPSDKSVGRGTVFHARFSGKRAVPFIDDGHIQLHVWCREQAGTLDRPVRYGLVVTIEAGEAIPVYEEISTRLQVRPRVAP